MKHEMSICVPNNILIPIFYRWENWGSEVYWFHITQPASGRFGVQAQLQHTHAVSLFPSPPPLPWASYSWCHSVRTLVIYLCPLSMDKNMTRVRHLCADCKGSHLGEFPVRDHHPVWCDLLWRLSLHEEGLVRGISGWHFTDRHKIITAVNVRSLQANQTQLQVIRQVWPWHS